MLAISAKSVHSALGGFRAGGGYLCRCPVRSHGQGRGDLHPSLSVTDGKSGLLFTCFAGCATAEIRDALASLDLQSVPAAPLHKSSALRTTTADALRL